MVRKKSDEVRLKESRREVVYRIAANYRDDLASRHRPTCPPHSLELQRHAHFIESALHYPHSRASSHRVMYRKPTSPPMAAVFPQAQCVTVRERLAGTATGISTYPLPLPRLYRLLLPLWPADWPIGRPR